MISSQSDGAASRTLSEGEIVLQPNQIVTGHYVTRMNIPWLDSPFPLEGILVETAETRTWMEDHCSWVVVDLARSHPRFQLSLESNRSPGPARTMSKLASPKIDALRQSTVGPESMDEALAGYDILSSQVHRLIHSLASEEKLDVVQANNAIGQLASSLEKNLGALVWLTRIKNRDSYDAEHCVNTAILAMGLAHALEWSPEDIEMAGLAGLLHDLGKLNLDSKILKKPGRLTPEEFAYVKTHTTKGYEMVKGDPSVPRKVALAMLEHHERPDGLGYPMGRKAFQVQPISSLISVVDAYDAITSHRVYDPARSHHDALSILWKQRGAQFDQSMVETFIQFVGWVTPGTLVNLSNGELAIVIETRLGQRLTPVVRLLRQSSRGIEPGPVRDLSSSSEKQADKTIRVNQILPDGTHGVDLKSLSRELVAGA